MSKFFFCFFTMVSLFAKEGYLWHRIRDEKCAETLNTFAQWKIYALTAEFQSGRKPVFFKVIAGTVPVIRIDFESLMKSDISEKLIFFIKKLPLGEIQFDCDVPESKIIKYVEFLSGLRKNLNSYFFSVTVLPCHLKHTEFKKIAHHVRYVVLQLHGLHKPENLPAKYKIFDILEAEKSVIQMRKLNIPFKIALPTYAYLVHYKNNGTFRRLSSEIIPVARKDELKKIAIPCWKEVIKFRKDNKDIPVIWFRLPYVGDRFALEPDNLKRIEANKLPVTKPEIIRQDCGNVTRFFWKNHGLLGTAYFTQNLGGYGEIFLYNSVVSMDSELIPGVIPKQISGPLPPPGLKILIGEIIQWQP